MPGGIMTIDSDLGIIAKTRNGRRVREKAAKNTLDSPNRGDRMPRIHIAREPGEQTGLAAEPLALARQFVRLHRERRPLRHDRVEGGEIRGWLGGAIAALPDHRPHSRFLHVEGRVRVLGVRTLRYRSASGERECQGAFQDRHFRGRQALRPRPRAPDAPWTPSGAGHRRGGQEAGPGEAGHGRVARLQGNRRARPGAAHRGIPQRRRPIPGHRRHRSHRRRQGGGAALERSPGSRSAGEELARAPASHFPPSQRDGRSSGRTAPRALWTSRSNRPGSGWLPCHDPRAHS